MFHTMEYLLPFVGTDTNILIDSIVGMSRNETRIWTWTFILRKIELWLCFNRCIGSLTWEPWLGIIRRIARRSANLSGFVCELLLRVCGLSTCIDAAFKRLTQDSSVLFSGGKSSIPSKMIPFSLACNREFDLKVNSIGYGLVSCWSGRTWGRRLRGTRSRSWGFWIWSKMRARKCWNIGSSRGRGKMVSDIII